MLATPTHDKPAEVKGAWIFHGSIVRSLANYLREAELSTEKSS